MPAEVEIDPDDAPLRQLHVELSILHPILTPGEITAALGLEGHVTRRVGDPRKTPKGRPLPGHYPRTSWRHEHQYELTHWAFADKITTLVDCLMPHKAFLHHVRATGGHATVIVQFLTDGHFSDVVGLDTLSKLVELQLDFGIERY